MSLENLPTIYPDFRAEDRVNQIPKNHKVQYQFGDSIIAYSEFTDIPMENVAHGTDHMSCKAVLAYRAGEVPTKRLAASHALLTLTEFNPYSKHVITQELRKGSQLAIFDNPWYGFKLASYSPETAKSAIKYHQDLDNLFWTTLGITEAHPQVRTIDVAPPLPSYDGGLPSFDIRISQEGISFWSRTESHSHIEAFDYYPMSALFTK